MNTTTRKAIRKTCPDCRGNGQSRCGCSAGRGDGLPRATCEECGTRFPRECDTCDGTTLIGCGCDGTECQRCHEGVLACPSCAIGVAGCPDCGSIPEPACLDCEDTGLLECSTCRGRGEIALRLEFVTPSPTVH